MLTLAGRPLATQWSYSDMKLAAVAGCGGRLALKSSLTVLALGEGHAGLVRERR
jgi:hypothetical protein